MGGGLLEVGSGSSWVDGWGLRVRGDRRLPRCRPCLRLRSRPCRRRKTAGNAGARSAPPASVRRLPSVTSSRSNSNTVVLRPGTASAALAASIAGRTGAQQLDHRAEHLIALPPGGASPGHAHAGPARATGWPGRSPAPSSGQLHVTPVRRHGPKSRSPPARRRHRGPVAAPPAATSHPASPASREAPRGGMHAPQPDRGAPASPSPMPASAFSASMPSSTAPRRRSSSRHVAPSASISGTIGSITGAERSNGPPPGSQPRPSVRFDRPEPAAQPP